MKQQKIDFYGKELYTYKANLHTHSTVSDGRYTPQEMIRFYSGKEYDVLALTDHGKYNHLPALDSCGMTLLSGIELHPAGPRDTRWHLLCLGVPENAVPGDVENVPVQEVIDRVKAAGGLVFAAHPYWCGFQHENVTRLRGISGTEVWNTSCRYIGKAYNMQIWDDMLMQNFRYSALAVDDAHKDWDMFMGWTMICAEDPSPESLLKALESGSFYSSTGPEFTRLSWKNNVLEAEFSPCCEVVVLSSAYFGWSIRREEEEGALATSLKLDLSDKTQLFSQYQYLRIQLRDKNGKYAWSMPVYLN